MSISSELLTPCQVALSFFHVEGDFFYFFFYREKWRKKTLNQAKLDFFSGTFFTEPSVLTDCRAPVEPFHRRVSHR